MRSGYKIAVFTILSLAATSVRAEEIVWKQPRSQPRYHQNLHFEGNSVLHKRDVMKLQRALAMKGFYKGRIDGIWGGQTSQAILDYQSVHNQPLTGTVTVDTLHDLGVNVNPRTYRNEMRQQ